MFRKLTVAFLVLAFCLSVFAFGLDVPGQVTLEKEAKEISVSVENDSASEKDLRVEFYAPVDFEIRGLADSVAAQSTERFTIELQPDENLSGANYTATLIVNLGGEEEIRQIELALEKADEEAPADDFSGFAVFLTPALAGEILIDVILAIIAAILLIAFISRLAKRWS